MDHIHRSFYKPKTQETAKTQAKILPNTPQTQQKQPRKSNAKEDLQITDEDEPPMRSIATDNGYPARI
jgi:hypothetical protein